MNNYRTTCRLCDGKLNLLLDLGHQAPSDAFLTKEQLNEPETTYPLRLCQCEDCGLHQLDYVVPPEILYQQEYPYESSTTEGGKKHYFEFAKSVVERFKLTSEDFIIDIGSNVGVLLEGFKNQGCNVLGVDPAPNIVKIANERGIDTICEFFTSKTFHAIYDEAEEARTVERASVITGTNVFAHVDDLKDFMAGIKKLLKKDGVFIFESPNMADLVQENAYSSIYHEHLSYLSLDPVVWFMDEMGFEVFHVEHRDIHEGSLRVFVGFPGQHEMDESVGKRLIFEDKILAPKNIQEFCKKTIEHLNHLRDTILDLKRKGKTICLLSAPAKGMTLINTLGLPKNTFEFATEKSKLKIGKYCPQSQIRVVSDEALLAFKPDYALLLAWNFSQEIMKNNKEYTELGGNFMVPFPELSLYNKDNEYGN